MVEEKDVQFAGRFLVSPSPFRLVCQGQRVLDRDVRELPWKLPVAQLAKAESLGKS